MAKVISIAVIVFMLLLLPPAALAILSQNALPGNQMYPIKRKMEEGILALASLNPTTKAYFSVNLSQVRFEEVKSLLARSDPDYKGITELVTQTDQAAAQIARVSDPAQRSRLIAKLSDSITEYNREFTSEQTQNSTAIAINNITQNNPSSNTTPPPPPAPGNPAPPPPPPPPPPPASANPNPPPAVNPNQVAIDQAKKDLEEIQRKLLEEQKKT